MSKLEELIERLCPDGVVYCKIKDFCTINRGRVISKEFLSQNQGIFPVYSSQTTNGGVFGYINTFDFDIESITWTTDGANAGSVFYHNNERFSITNVGGLMTIKNKQILHTKFLFYYLTISMKKYVSSGMGNPKLMSNTVAEITFPLPPIEVQQEIVRILDTFTSLEAELEAELEARKKQYDYYRDNMLTNGDDVEFKKIRDVYRRLKGTPITAEKMKQIENLDGDVRIFAGGKTVINAFENDVPNANITRVPAVLIQSRGVIDAIYYNRPFTFKNEMWAYTAENQTSVKYLYYVLKNNIQYFRDAASGMGSLPQISLKVTEEFLIPVPSLEKQARIVDILERFDTLVNDLSHGLPAEIAARRKQYEYYRNKLLTFKEVKHESV